MLASMSATMTVVSTLAILVEGNDLAKTPAPSAISTTFLKALSEEDESKYFGDRMWTAAKVNMADSSEFITLFMIPVTVSAMVLCIAAYGAMGLTIVWTQHKIMVVLARWVQGSIFRVLCNCCCCCCCRCCCRQCHSCYCCLRKAESNYSVKNQGFRRFSTRNMSPYRQQTLDMRTVEERTIAQVGNVVRFVPWLIVCVLVPSCTIVFGLLKWLPTTIVINFFIGNAMYAVAKVQITSAQCTGLGIVEGLLLIYFSLGRNFNKAVFLFPRHNIKSYTYRLVQSAINISKERLLDLSWSIGVVVPGVDPLGGLQSDTTMHQMNGPPEGVNAPKFAASIFKAKERKRSSSRPKPSNKREGIRKHPDTIGKKHLSQVNKRHSFSSLENDHAWLNGGDETTMRNKDPSMRTSRSMSRPRNNSYAAHA